MAAFLFLPDKYFNEIANKAHNLDTVILKLSQS